jgi:hypothetical protein
VTWCCERLKIKKLKQGKPFDLNPPPPFCLFTSHPLTEYDVQNPGLTVCLNSRDPSKIIALMQQQLQNGEIQFVLAKNLDNCVGSAASWRRSPHKDLMGAAMDALVAAMIAHPSVVDLQAAALYTLQSMCADSDYNADIEHTQRLMAANDGYSKKAIAAALQLHKADSGITSSAQKLQSFFSHVGASHVLPCV